MRNVKKCAGSHIKHSISVYLLHTLGDGVGGFSFFGFLAGGLLATGPLLPPPPPPPPAFSRLLGGAGRLTAAGLSAIHGMGRIV